MRYTIIVHPPKNRFVQGGSASLEVNFSAEQEQILHMYWGHAGLYKLDNKDGWECGSIIKCVAGMLHDYTQGDSYITEAGLKHQMLNIMRMAYIEPDSKIQIILQGA